jgi:signal transduction histidine kinase/CheY-like chemotaxis protein
MSPPLLSLVIRHEHDIVAARQRARQLAALVGFDAQDQTRIATAVSEIARNAFQYAEGGRIEFVVEGRTAPQIFLVRVCDEGPGIADVSGVLTGHYRSRTGMGLGILGARRLMDQFHLESSSRGTTVSLRKLFPGGAAVLAPRDQARLAGELARQRPQSLLEEVQQQNQELMRALDELRLRQEDLRRLNSELEDTNRGVVALYAELDEKADHLRRADEVKSRFLSNMSHEFRTPLNSILALSRLLLEEAGPGLGAEQITQVQFIRRAAEDLSELVNDLLDLAKVEAGKIVVRPLEFEVPQLFAALRGMLRPLLVADALGLVFEEAQGLPALHTDEGKVSQILRNFISNALKFTERGEIRVSAALAADGQSVVFAVSDTGIGIAPEDQERIFQEFGQLDNPVQKRVKGTGLGLPLSRKLARLLGGDLTVESQPGAGSTFRAVIPVVYREPAPVSSPAPAVLKALPGLTPILVVEDRREDLLLYQRFLRGTRFQVLTATTLRQARRLLDGIRPRAIVLDILLGGEDSWKFLAELKADPARRDIPVVVVTTIDDPRKGLALGADAYALKPVERGWLLETLAVLTAPAVRPRVLVVDDDASFRYLFRRFLEGAGVRVTEAAGGAEGIERARAERPAVIFLDLAMPEPDGVEVLERLKADPATAEIPVVVVTSQVPGNGTGERLARHAARLLAKEALLREDVVTIVRETLAAAGGGGES